jgi:signal transduction histidine kinase
MPIRVRIAVLGAGVVALTLAVFGFLVWLSVARGLVRQQDQALSARVDQAIASIARAGRDELSPRPDLVPFDLAKSSDTFVEILDRGGTILSTSAQIAGVPPIIPPGVLQAANAGEAHATVHVQQQLQLRLDARPWSRADLGLAGFVVAGQPTRGNVQQLMGLGTLFFILALITLLAALGAIWFLSGRALRPFKTMARTADEIGGAEDLNRRLPPVSTHDELGMLTSSFNGMLARLEESQQQLAEANHRLAASLEAQTRFVADASHELRTPLTTIRNNAGFLLRHPEADPYDRRTALEDIAGEGERMARLVQDLLTLARADAGQHLEKQPIELRSIVREVTRQARAVHPDRRFLSGEGPALTMSGNADALKQLLWILVDNAAKHTTAGGQIVLDLSERDGRALLSVSDDGCGIPEQDLERVFERFFQADRARSGGGAGLGLAIAGWIVQEHGGRICARNNPTRGATFTVELPGGT